MKKQVIFDMDGVIFDSEALVLSCWKIVAEKYGLEGIEDVFRMCIGTNHAETMHIVRRQLGETFDYEVFSTAASALSHKKTDLDGVPVKEGVRELLCYFRDNGYRIGLASSTRKEVVVQELGQAGLLDYFSVVVGGDMVRRSKPDPEIYLRACREMEADPTETFAIEDSLHGVRAAHAAGMRVFMVPDLVEPDEAVTKLAFAVYPSLLGVLGYFQSQ